MIVGVEGFEAPVAHGEGHDEVGVADAGVGGFCYFNGGLAGEAASGIAEAFELGGEGGLTGEMGGWLELAGLDGMDEGFDEIELGDVEEVDGECGVGGLGVLAGGSEDDAFEAGLGLARLGGEFAVEDLEGGATDAGGVGDEVDGGGGVLLFVALDGEVSVAGDVGVGGAEGEDFGGDEKPVVGAGMAWIDPGVGAVDLFNIGDEGEGAGVCGLAEVETEEGVEVAEVGHG